MSLESIVHSNDPKQVQNKIREYLKQRNINPPSDISSRYFPLKNTRGNLAQKIKSKTASLSDFRLIPVECFGYIPIVLIEVVEFIKLECYHMGIFRVSPNSRKIEDLLRNIGEDDWLSSAGVYEVAGIFLKLLSCFGGPIIGPTWGPVVRKCIRSDNSLLFYVLALLPVEMTCLLKYSMSCLCHVGCRSEENLMDVVNLSTVVMPAVIDYVKCSSKSSLKETLLLDRRIVERLIIDWESIGMYDREMLTTVMEFPRGLLSNMTNSCVRLAKRAANMSRSMLSSRMLKRGDEQLNRSKYPLFRFRSTRVQNSVCGSPMKSFTKDKTKSVKPLAEENVSGDVVVFQKEVVGTGLFNYSTDSDS